MGNPYELETSKRARQRNKHSFCLSCSRKRYASPDTPNIDRSGSGKHSSPESRHQRHSSSHDRVPSKINLSSILEQESSEDYPRERSHSSGRPQRGHGHGHDVLVTQKKVQGPAMN